MMRTKSIPEILKECEKLESSEERVKYLKNNDTKTLRQVIYSAFHPDVDFVFPTTRPDFTVNPGPIGVCETHLYREAKKIKYFIKNFTSSGTKMYKLENVFIEMLESLHETESELLLQICVDRNLQTDLKYEEVQLAFPDMLPLVEKVVEEVVEKKEPKKITSKKLKNKKKKTRKTKIL